MDHDKRYFTVDTKQKVVRLNMLSLFILCIFTFFLSVALFDKINAQQVPSLNIEASQKVEPIYAPIAGIVGAIIGSIGTVLLSPWIKEKFTLREQYFVPFKKWCSELYGDLTEFKWRYIEKEEYLDDTKVSHVQVILDFRSLHDSLIEAPRWIGKIEKEKGRESNVYKQFYQMIESVEKSWHSLENEFGGEKLPSTEKVKEFNQVIKELTMQERQEIARKIRDHLHDESANYTNEIAVILEYLGKQIPQASLLKELKHLFKHKS